MFIKNRYSFISDETKLWRYMSFSNFFSLLETSALYFCRIDCFSDNLEATQPKEAERFATITGNPWQVFTKLCVDKQLEIYRNITFANCWHINEQENPTMWENYVMAHGNEGIAIQTCFQNLVECFNTDRALTNLKMKYIDYDTEFLDYGCPNYAVYLSIKDVKYEYENELRVITLEKEIPHFDADEMDMDKKIEVYSQKGEFIKIDLKMLIQKLYLSPNSTTRFKENIEQLLHKYGITVPVIKSV